MDSDTSSPTTTSSDIATSSKKPSQSRFKNFFNCWKKKQDGSGDNRDNKSQSDQKSGKKTKFQDKGTTTDEFNKSKENKQTDPMTDGDTSDNTQHGDSNSKERNGKKDKHGNEKQQSRCPKCFKKKREKDPSGQRLDKRFCKCRNGGYCNTNTIVFPSNFNKGSTGSIEFHYLQLIRDIIKTESRQNVGDLSEFKREMDKQRDEIKELKQLILQSLLTNAKSDNRKHNAVGDESLIPSSSRESQVATGRKPMQSRNYQGNNVGDIPSKSSKGERGTDAQDPDEIPEKRGLWSKFFGKK